MTFTRKPIMPERLTKRISTLRITDSDYNELEKILIARKKELGIRGENLKLQNIVRDAIDHYLRYIKGEFMGEPSHLEKTLNGIVEMRDELSEVLSFIKFLQKQSGLAARERKGR